MQNNRGILARPCIRRKAEEEQPARDCVSTGEGESKPGTAVFSETQEVSTRRSWKSRLRKDGCEVVVTPLRGSSWDTGSEGW